MIQTRKVLLICLLGALVATLGSGCSSENPTGPSSEATNSQSPLSEEVFLTPASDPFQVTGRVESIDWEARQLTLIGYEYTITASVDCDITLIEQGTETPITFAEINVDDSLLACGKLLEDGSVLAHRIRVFSDSACDSCDVAFDGTIASIDYVAGTFTVAERGETILTDENTFLWTRIQLPRTGAAKTNNLGTMVPNLNHVRFRSVYDTVLTFADLKVGDSVSVKADIVDENTLLAVRIKLASDCYVRCVEFTDRLTLVDVDTRVVAFETESWNGVVCPKALLADVDGTPLTLADFSPSDLVAVRGYPAADDTLKICEMIKQ